MKSCLEYGFISGYRARIVSEFRGGRSDMSEFMLHDVGSGFLERRQLLRLKKRAMRAGVWFRALRRIDRVLVDLTIRVADGVRSLTLAKNILTVVRKLGDVMENRLLRAVREAGLPVARRLASFAQKWGNRAAEHWGSDVGFARYWAALSLNEPKLFSG
jgi:hypothetical protein